MLDGANNGWQYRERTIGKQTLANKRMKDTPLFPVSQMIEVVFPQEYLSDNCQIQSSSCLEADFFLQAVDAAATLL
jgi:hypothetical protein